MTAEQEQETREEANRLKVLPLEERRAFIAMLRADARNRKVRKRDRELSGERAELLEKLLRMKTLKND